MCIFPGCEMQAFLHPHHIVHWTPDGPTDMSNLGMLCTRHHTLVHEGGWSVILDQAQEPVFFRPSGRRYDPSPPGVEEQMLLRAEEERKTPTKPGPTPLEERFGLENFRLQEIAAGFADDLYEVAKNLAGI